MSAYSESRACALELAHCDLHLVFLLDLDLAYLHLTALPVDTPSRIHALLVKSRLVVTCRSLPCVSPPASPEVPSQASPN